VELTLGNDQVNSDGSIDTSAADAATYELTSGGTPGITYQPVPLLPPSSDFGLPGWLPPSVASQVASNSKLRDEVLRMDFVVTGDLDDFMGLWEDASSYPNANWTNDGCSDRNAVSGADPACLAHDAVYRGAGNLASELGLGTEFLKELAPLKEMADAKLQSEIGGIRGRLVGVGVRWWGSSFYDPTALDDWKEQVRKCGPFGCSSRAVTP